MGLDGGLVSTFMAMRSPETDQANQLLKCLHPLTSHLINNQSKAVSSPPWDRSG